MAGEDNDIPPWVKWLTEQMDRKFGTLNETLSQLVTRDSFIAEQTRVNEKFSEQGREIGQLRGSLEKESLARVTSEQNLAKERLAEQQLREKEQGNRRWMWFALIASPLATLVLTWIAQGGLAS